MKIKVCGMKDPTNTAAVSKLHPDMMGFILFRDSPRYVEPEALKNCLTVLDPSVERVAVFVNAQMDEVIRTVETFGFDLVQLHGEEPVAYCQHLTEQGIRVIKAFGVDQKLSARSVARYLDVVELFLFDSKTAQRGGSGRRFDHSLLKLMPSKDFLLSGGMGVSDVIDVANAGYPGLVGMDVNSAVELTPGYKDLKKLSILMNERERHGIRH